MTIQEQIIKQIANLRACFDAYKKDADSHTKALNDFEREEARSGMLLIGNQIFDETTGEQLFLTNDTARKAFVKDQTLVLAETMNIEKKNRDSSLKKIEVEISVLSALKQLCNDENFDREILGKYDI